MKRIFLASVALGLAVLSSCFGYPTSYHYTFPTDFDYSCID